MAAAGPCTPGQERARGRSRVSGEGLPNREPPRPAPEAGPLGAGSCGRSALRRGHARPTHAPQEPRARPWPSCRHSRVTRTHSPWLRLWSADTSFTEPSVGCLGYTWRHSFRIMSTPGVCSEPFSLYTSSWPFIPSPQTHVSEHLPSPRLLNNLPTPERWILTQGHRKELYLGHFF